MASLADALSNPAGSTRQLAVQLPIPPVLTFRLPGNLPRLAACTFNLPVHAIKLAAHLTRLPGDLLHLPPSIVNLPLRLAWLQSNFPHLPNPISDLPTRLAWLAAQISPLPVHLACLPVHLARLPVHLARLAVHISSKNPCFSLFSRNLPPMDKRMPLDCADTSALCFDATCRIRKSGDLSPQSISQPFYLPRLVEEKDKKKPKNAKPRIDASNNISQ